MSENFQGKLHHKECKKSKGAKIYTSIRRELESENISMTANYLQDKILKKTCKTKQMQNIPVTLRKFLNQLKVL